MKSQPAPRSGKVIHYDAKLKSGPRPRLAVTVSQDTSSHIKRIHIMRLKLARAKGEKMPTESDTVEFILKRGLLVSDVEFSGDVD